MTTSSAWTASAGTTWLRPSSASSRAYKLAWATNLIATLNVRSRPSLGNVTSNSTCKQCMTPAVTPPRQTYRFHSLLTEKRSPTNYRKYINRKYVTVCNNMTNQYKSTQWKICRNTEISTEAQMWRLSDLFTADRQRFSTVQISSAVKYRQLTIKDLLWVRLHHRINDFSMDSRPYRSQYQTYYPGLQINRS